ncbi:GNAT family N-acetyltransferase [Aquabacter cavernae]|uniref:GNAT family N-acetyltransferase n=1 Tax=Aquabacter cavernae TaxID=2496029 RepID=UPI000F8D18FA|nr:GNAT family protein [Aquabacter cavernae]
MWLLSSILSPDVLPAVNGDGVYLRVPQMRDYDEWRELRETSRAFLTPWEPIWAADDLTKPAFRRRLRRYARDMVRDEAYPLFLFRASDDRLMGGLTLSNVRRGICQAASLGYWMGAPFAGQGYMRAAVRTMLPVAHQALGLHRIEAACMTNNTPSIRLLEGLGFVREGLARRYLCINGMWEDHFLFARLADDPPGAVASPARNDLPLEATTATTIAPA